MDTDTTYSEPIVDGHGRVMFWCAECGSAMSRSDVLDLGMRLPDYGETAEEYLDAELIDAFSHPTCVAAARAG
jgi:hypothetical protein